MSCIVAHGPQQWIAADTRLSGGSEIVLCESKKIVRVGGHTLIGFVGQFGVLEMLEPVIADASENPETIVKAVAGWFREKFFETDKADAEVTIVDRKGKITVIGESGGIFSPTHAFYASGSGRQAAHGYLKGIDACRPITVQDGLNAIVVASSMESGVGQKTEYLALI